MESSELNCGNISPPICTNVVVTLILRFLLDCFLRLRNIMTNRAVNTSHLGDTAAILNTLIAD